MRRVGLIMATVVFLAAACGGNDGGSTPADTGGPGTDTVTQDESSAPEDTGSEDTAPNCSEGQAMEFFGLQDGMTIETGEQMQIQVRVFSTVLNDVVPGVTVHFGLEGAGDALLLADSAVTNEMGVAFVTMDTGSTLEVAYTLSASTACIDEMSIQLLTVTPEQGSFVVTLTISADLAALWSDLDLEVYADNTIPLCGAVDYTAPQGQPVVLPTGEQVVELPNVLANSAYVVYAVGRNDQGLPVGGGCTDGISVLPDKTEDVAVELWPLSLDPKGGFDLEVTADLTSLLAPVWQDPGAILAGVVEQSGDIISQRVMDDLMIWFPDGLPECGDMDIEADITGSIEAGMGSIDTTDVDWLAANADAILKELLAGVVFAGSFKVDGTDEFGVFTGTWNLESLRYAGDVDCGEADCAAWLEFAPDTFSLGDVHLELDQQLFTLAADGFDVFLVPETQWSMAPGKVMLFAFANVVLRLRDSSNELADLFANVYSCKTLMSKISAQTIACINKPQTQLIASCDAAVASLQSDVYAQLAALLAPQHVLVSAALDATDADSDLVVDTLGGSLVGDYVNDGDTVGPVDFSLSATR